MGGGRRAPFGAGEREKALEAVRAVTQPKVCTLYHQATICLKVINHFHFLTRLDSTIHRQSLVASSGIHFRITVQNCSCARQHNSFLKKLRRNITKTEKELLL